MKYETVLRRFDDWLNVNFDMNHPRAVSKKEHVHSVANISTLISLAEGLNDNDTLLAQVIAVMHDVGRFPQLQKYGNFLDNDEYNHSLKGAEMLENGLLWKLFPEVKKEDEQIIITAVKYHGLLSLPTKTDERTLMHCKIIKDADKTDLYERSVNRFEELNSTHEIGEKFITPKVKQNFTNNENILIPDCKSKLDLLVLRLGFIYQYEFPSALKVIEEKRYIQRLVQKFRDMNYYDTAQLDWLESEAISKLEKHKATLK